LTHGRPVRVILVGGHESADGADLARIAGHLDNTVSAKPGRAFHNTVVASLEADETVVVVPMTFGRNPTMVADVAKTLKWLAAKYPRQIALAESFGRVDHLTAWLRAAANRAAAGGGLCALLIVAAPSNPFDEAELHRIAYLVATRGALDEVGVAIAGDEPGLRRAVERQRRLSVERVVTVPAGFAMALPEAGAEFAGPLMSEAAIIRVVGDRVADAVTALGQGVDGIDSGLGADHGHGYAHSHAFEESQGIAHQHGNSAPHAHYHPNGVTHTHAHIHDHH
jgi:hypothetical protein